MKSINKSLSIGLIIFLAVIIIQCDTKERFYRPDLPQKLCTVGIFDLDDTTIYDALYNFPRYRDTLSFARYISFEKSFQFEFPEEINNPLRELSFRISNDKEDIFVYQSNHTTKNLELILPDNIKFESGKKYFLRANEKETPDISAEIEVPGLPPELKLLSVKTEIITLDKPYLFRDHKCIFCQGKQHFEWKKTLQKEDFILTLRGHPKVGKKMTFQSGLKFEMFITD